MLILQTCFLLAWAKTQPGFTPSNDEHCRSSALEQCDRVRVLTSSSANLVVEFRGVPLITPTRQRARTCAHSRLQNAAYRLLARKQQIKDKQNMQVPLPLGQ